MSQSSTGFDRDVELEAGVVVGELAPPHATNTVAVARAMTAHITT
jgi:hypothetical protein